jgi:hypothetical protein
MDRHHRLEFKDVLRALVRPDVQVGVVLERQDGEIADRILRLLGDIRLVSFAEGVVVNAGAGRLVLVRRRLLGVAARASEEQGPGYGGEATPRSAAVAFIGLAPPRIAVR